MRPQPTDAYGWVHCTMAGFLCDHCETTRTLDDRLTQRDFQREAYDFLLRHKHCRPVERVQ